MFLPMATGQFHLGGLELDRRDHRVHRHQRRFFVGHLDADGPFAGDGSDDADPQGRERESDVVFEVLDLRDLHPGSRDDLVQGNGRPDGGMDVRDVDVVILERLDDPPAVGDHFFLVDIDPFVVELAQELDRREFVSGKVERGVVFTELLHHTASRIVIQFALLGGYRHGAFHTVFLFVQGFPFPGETFRRCVGTAVLDGVMLLFGGFFLVRIFLFRKEGRGKPVRRRLPPDPLLPIPPVRLPAAVLLPHRFQSPLERERWTPEAASTGRSAGPALLFPPADAKLPPGGLAVRPGVVPVPG